VQRLIARVEGVNVYIGYPRMILKRGLDYRYEAGRVRLLGKGFECLGRRVEAARRVRRMLRQDRVSTCPSRLVESITPVECEAVLDGGRPPSPDEILVLVYTAYLYRLVEEGELSIASIARLYAGGACSVVEGGFFWHVLEERLDRHPLRLSAARLVKAEYESIHTSIAPVYRGGRLGIRGARCYIGVRDLKALYELYLPEEVEAQESIRVYIEAHANARRKLAELIGYEPEPVWNVIRAGAGTWPLTSIAALAWLNGLASGTSLETIFSAYRRCGGPRLWPPNNIELMVVHGGKLVEHGLLGINFDIL